MAVAFSRDNCTTSNCSHEVQLSAKLGASVTPVKDALPVLLLFFGVSFVANLYLLIAARWIRKTFSPNLVFTTSLTASDAWLSLAIFVALCSGDYLPILHGSKLYGRSSNCVTLVFEAIRLSSMMTAILHLLAQTTNLYISIVMPMQYKRGIMTPRFAYGTVICLWILPLVALFVFFGSIPGQAFRAPKCRNAEFYGRFRFRIVGASFVLLSLLGLLIVYVHVNLVIQRAKLQRASLTNGSQNSQTRAHDQHRRQRNYKAFMTTFFVVGTYIIGWVPSMLCYILFCQSGCYFLISQHIEVVGWLWFMSHCLIGVKCIANPLIYALRVDDYRKALTQLNQSIIRWCCGRCRNGPRGDNDDANGIRELSLSGVHKNNGHVAGTSSSSAT